jgi:hypothetical protein
MNIAIIIGVRIGEDRHRFRNAFTVLRALSNQSARRDQYAIVLVEQDKERSFCLDAEPMVDLALWDDWDGPYNRSRAFNRGYEAAWRSQLIGDDAILCFLDADLMIGSGWIVECANQMCSLKADALLPYTTVDYLSRTGTAQMFAGCDDPDVERRAKSAVGGVIWVTAQMFEKVGGYDDNFEGWGAEDNDFYLRLLEATEVLRMDRLILHLWHPRPVVDQEGYEKNIELLKRKHPQRSDAISRRRRQRQLSPHWQVEEI